MKRLAASRLARMSVHKVTPTPNPSPQGGGGLGRRYLARNHRRLATNSTAAKSPSPLRGGVRGGGPAKGILAALLLLILPSLTLAASNNDLDWPCVQRKVPELSLGQVWNGPQLPEAASGWANDKDVSDLVAELAQRRIPVADAQKEIRDFAGRLASGEAATRLSMLAQGLFDHMNAERAQVISGIGRYARKQIELAARLRKEASELDAMRNKPDADANEIAARTDQLAGETRIFEERVQSLTYVCEVPTLIEQRLYALSKTVAEEMKGK